MTKREAYLRGRDAGQSAATHCETASRDDCCGACADQENGCLCPSRCAECLSAEAFESEQNARDYSPWEFVAAEINAARDPEGQWDAYDAGVAAGIKAGVKARLAVLARAF